MMLTPQFFKGLRNKIKALNNTYQETFEEPIIKDWYQIVIHLRNNGGEVQYYYFDPDQTDDQAVCLVSHDEETNTSKIVFVPYEEITLVETRITHRVGEADSKRPRPFGFQIDQQSQ